MIGPTFGGIEVIMLDWCLIFGGPLRVLLSRRLFHEESLIVKAAIEK